MEYLSAYTLASLSGKQPTEEQIKKIIAATGKTADDKQIKSLFTVMKGKKVEDLIRNGSKKVGSVGAPAAGKAKQSTKQAPKKEQKKAEKKVQKAQEPEPVQQAGDEFGAGDLFGGDF